MAVAIQSAAPESIVTILARRASSEPHCVVYRFVSESTNAGDPVLELTYGELHDRARRIAGALRKLSPSTKSAVLLYPSGPEFIASFFGCLCAGVIAVPAATPRLLSDIHALRALASDAAASVVLTTPAMQSRLRQQAAANDDGADLRILAWSHSDFEPQNEIAQPYPEDIAYLQYTSGSTADPKGVMISHGNVLSNMEFIQRDFQHDRASISVTWLPHFHDMGLVYGLLQPVYNGFLSIVMSPSGFAKTPVSWLEAISVNKASHSGAPNFAYDLCLRKIPPELRKNLNLSSWRVAFNGAETVRRETMDRFSEAFAACGFGRSAFYPAYGLAEATLKVSGRFLEKSSLREFNLEAEKGTAPEHSVLPSSALVSCGKSSPETKVVVVDAQTRLPVTDGVVGEVWVKGPSVAKGYWNRLGETERTFGACLADTGEGPFLRTGDLGITMDGELFVAGRLKDMIIVYGENHYPQDIEATVSEASLELNGQLACAFAITADDRERVIVICEINRRKESANLEELAARIRALVTQTHGIPLHSVCFVRVGMLPKTSSGKLQRNRTSQQYVSGKMRAIYESKLAEAEEHAAAGDMNETAIEQRLREIASQVLGRDVSAREAAMPLTALGIDSLQAQELRARIEVEFAQLLSLERLLGGGALKQLAAELELGNTKKAIAETRPLNGFPESELLPLSPEQERLWYAYKLAPQSSAHNMAVALRLRGTFDINAWNRALAEIEGRHDGLRSAFLDLGGTPRRRIRPLRKDIVEFVDLSAGKEGEAEARKIIEAAGDKPFNLEHDPMLRAIVVRIREHEHVAALIVHHIAFDIWSLQVMLKEIRQSYERVGVHGPADSQVLDGSYSSYVAETRNWLTTAAAAQDEAFWRERLKASPAATALPYDNPRPARRSYKAGEVNFHVRGALLQNLQELAQSEGVTSFVVLLSTLRVLLYAMAKESDVVIGAPVANRGRQECRNVIGLFAHPVPIRIALAGEDHFRQLLKRTSAEVLSALDHQELPFARIVEVAAPARVSTYTPLFNVMFGFHGPILDTRSIAAMDIERFEISKTGTDFDLFFDVESSPESLNIAVTYDSDLFFPETVKAITSGYLAVLNQMVGEPGRSILSVALPKALAARPVQVVNPAVEAAPALKVVVAATFVAEPINEIFEWWCSELHLPITLEFAPFSQLPQQLLDAKSTLRTNTSGVNVLLVRASDLHEDESSHSLAEMLANAVSSNPVMHLVYLCPSADGTPGAVNGGQYQREKRLAESLSKIRHVETILPEQLQAIYPVQDWSDPIADRIASIPYTGEFFAGLATHILRKVIASVRKPIKALAVDCDQTLWRGICGEDGPENVEITDDHRALHEFLLERQQRGVLLCLCSKNNTADIDEVFRSNKGMLLKQDDFSAKKVNWQPKSVNLRELSQELGLALDSFVLIDDDPRECAEVAANCSRVAIIGLPSDCKRYRTFLDHHWLLDQAVFTEESRNRTALYKEHARREEGRRSASDLKGYIESLEIKVRFYELSPENADRAAELTYRTTQFNTSGEHWNAGQLKAEVSAGRLIAVLAEVEDRYGSYGIVGLMLLRPSGKVFILELFALSCRALGRGIEYRMMSEAVRLARENACDRLEIQFKRSKRNTPAFEFVRWITHSREVELPLGATHSYSLSTEQSIEMDSEIQPDVPVATQPMAGDEEAPTNNDRFWIPVEQLNWIASRFSNAAVILEKARTATKLGRPATLAHASPAASPTEKTVAAIWEEVLNVEQVGRLDDFFELGGHSMKAVQVLARVQEKFGLELALDLMFEGAPTVADLSRAIDEQLLREVAPHHP
jgi:FkbH-like protein